MNWTLTLFVVGAYIYFFNLFNLYWSCYTKSRFRTNSKQNLQASYTRLRNNTNILWQSITCQYCGNTDVRGSKVRNFIGRKTENGSWCQSEGDQVDSSQLLEAYSEPYSVGISCHKVGSQLSDLVTRDSCYFCYMLRLSAVLAKPTVTTTRSI